jgi:hypothetical protein
MIVGSGEMTFNKLPTQLNQNYRNPAIENFYDHEKVVFWAGIKDLISRPGPKLRKSIPEIR